MERRAVPGRWPRERHLGSAEGVVVTFEDLLGDYAGKGVYNRESVRWYVYSSSSYFGNEDGVPRLSGKQDSLSRPYF